MVIVREIATTITLLRKYWPMFAADHARAKLSHSRPPGSPTGSVRNSPLVLKADRIAHTSGNVVMIAQKIRNPLDMKPTIVWLKSRRRGGPWGEVAAVTTGRSVCMVLIRPAPLPRGGSGGTRSARESL